MAYRDEWEVAQEMCSTGRGEKPWHECVSSALVGQRGGCLEASAAEQKDNMVKEGNGASASGEKICLQD